MSERTLKVGDFVMIPCSTGDVDYDVEGIVESIEDRDSVDREVVVMIQDGAEVILPMSILLQ